jgi:hypothetical protein
MPTNLEIKLHDIATQFVKSIIDALQECPLSEITQVASGTSAPAVAKKASTPSTGRLMRRSDEELHGVVDQIVAVVAKAENGLRSEDIQTQTNLSKKEVVRPIQLALDSGALRREGQKRSTTYFVGKGTVGSKKPKPAKTEPIVVLVHNDKKKPAAKKAAAKVSATPKKKATPKKPAAKEVASSTEDHSEGNSKPIDGLAASSALP